MNDMIFNTIPAITVKLSKFGHHKAKHALSKANNYLDNTK